MHANVEDRGIKGDITPLMAAANGGHVKIVKLLLAHGADVNAQSSTGKGSVSGLVENGWKTENCMCRKHCGNLGGMGLSQETQNASLWFHCLASLFL